MKKSTMLHLLGFAILVVVCADHFSGEADAVTLAGVALAALAFWTAILLKEKGR